MHADGFRVGLPQGRGNPPAQARIRDRYRRARRRGPGTTVARLCRSPIRLPVDSGGVRSPGTA